MIRARLLVADLAGTTVDDPGLVLAAFCTALDAVDAPQPDEHRLVELMGVDKREAMARLLGCGPDDPQVEAALAAFVARAVADAEQGRYPPLPGVESTLQALQDAGIRIAFTTGFGREVLDAIVAANHWERFDQGSVASDEVPRGRPAPDLVHEAMRRTGVSDPAQVAVVGDTLSDLGCAAAAGAGWAVAVTTGSGQPHELQAVPWAVVIDRFDELRGLLLGSGQPQLPHQARSR